MEHDHDADGNRTKLQGVVVVRVFLGIAKAGFFPAASYILTCWYLKHELQLRIGYSTMLELCQVRSRDC